MKTVILAGGFGTRLQEATSTMPKPMVEVGGRPLVWHIMRIYAAAGFSDFVVALGYRGNVIKDYFRDYYHHVRDIRIRLGTGDIETMGEPPEDWTVHLVDTGMSVMTGGRMMRLRDHVGEGTFMLTYGDGVADIDPRRLLDFHRAHGRLATVTAVRPPGRFGSLTLDHGSADRVVAFREKQQADEGWINGGFFVFEPGIFDYLGGDDCVLESEPMERLTRDGQLVAYRHDAFWQCMDTARDLQLLEELWEQGRAPWQR
ncbi:MAG: glucose-1-phosphate cytidylyltransferase [Candidatus Dormibacteria bacterium]